MSLLKAKQLREDALKKEQRISVALAEATDILNKAQEAGEALTPELRTKVDSLKMEVKTLPEQVAELRSDAEMFEQSANNAKEKAQKRQRVIPGTMGNSETREKSELGSKFSFKRMIETAAGRRNQDGAEGEMFQEAQREAREAGVSFTGNAAVPSWFLSIDKRHHGITPQYRDMVSGTDATGGYTVEQTLGEFIPVLRPRLKTVELGATVMSGLVGNLDLPRDTTNLLATWKAENATADELTPTLDDINMTPNRLTAFTDVSRTLLAQSSINVQSYVVDKLNFAVASALDLAGINGSGSGAEPTGILGTSGIGDVAGGTNGAAPDFADIIDLETAVAVDNADVANMAYLTTPGVRGKLKKTALDAGSGLFVWGGDMNGYNAHVSTQVPSTLSKGSASAICHAILFGNWASLIYGQWAGVDFIINPYTKGKEALVEIIVHSYYDIAVEHPESFAAMQDALV